MFSATLRELATICREEYPNAAHPLNSNSFTDDFVAGFEDGNGGISIYYEISALMKTIKLPIAKCATSCEKLKGISKAEVQQVQMTTLALGVDWNTESVTLSAVPRDIQDKITQRPQTKMQLLQKTVRFYDPLGLFPTFSAFAKIPIQEAWCRGMQWEEILSHVIGARWHAWITSLPFLEDIDLPR